MNSLFLRCRRGRVSETAARRSRSTPRLERLEDRALLAVVTPFTPRFSTNDTGEILLVGDTLETVSTTGNPGRTQQAVIDAQNGVGPNVNNNNWNMSFVDSDGDPTTFNSSRATLSLAPGATVLFAGLYWGSVTTTPAQASARTQVLFGTPTSGGYTPLTGTLTGATNFTGQPQGSIYQGFADVTSLVASGGSGTYTVANVQGALQSGSYAGWSLVVVVRAPGNPARNLTVLDGFAVQQSTDPPLNIPVSGFITPPSGVVNSKIGVVAYEGDLGTTGDSMAINGTRLSDNVNPVNNFFNSTISNEGQLLTGKNSNYVNQLGFGIKNVRVPRGVIPNGATNATITLETNGDGFFPGVVAFATDLFSPNVPVAKSYTDLNGGKVGPGDVVEFALTFTNNGQDAADNLLFTDAIPAHTTYVPGSLEIVSGVNAGPKTDQPGDDQAEIVGDSVAFQLGTGADAANGGALPIGASTTIRFRVVVDDDAPNFSVVTNQGTATFTGATTGFDLSSVSNPVGFTVEAQADLQIFKTVSDTAPVVGQAITYTVTVSNLGPNTATNVSVFDLLPDDVSFAGATPSVGEYDSTTGVWHVGTLANGAAAQLFVQAIVNDAQPGENRATILTSNVPDPNPNNNTATSLITPQSADLHLVKSIDDPTPNVGQTVTFSVTLTNFGPNTATNTQVSDPLPSGLTFQGATPGAGAYDSGSGLWSIGDLASGATVTLTISALVGDNRPQLNTAVASADQFDPNPADNNASAVESPQQADLQISKTVNNENPQVGESVIFTLTLSNLDNNTATNVIVTDLLPPGFSFSFATPSQGSYNNVTGLWNVGALAGGAAATLVIQAIDLTPSPATNVATITQSDQFDPNLENNTSSAVVVPLTADLVLTKVVSDPTPNVGQEITYTLTVTNQGPFDTPFARVSDSTPAGLTFLNATFSREDSTYNPKTGEWLIGPLGIEETVTMTITARVDSPLIATNAAVASSRRYDPVPTNNQARVTITPLQADLGITKTIDDPNPNVGGTITFTVQVVNDGPDDATNVTVRDFLPEGLGFLNATPDQGTYDPGSGLWTVGDLADGATVTLTIQAIVFPPFQEIVGYPVTNFATVGADQFDPDSSNNLSSVQETPQEADLVVAKTVSDAAPNVGDTIVYTVTLTNNGPSDATAVTVSDPLPTDLTLVSFSAGAGASYDPGTGLWTVGTIGNGASVVLTITMRVTSPTAQSNVATINHADQFDTNPSNNTASVTETPKQADLRITKAVDDSTPNLGDTITFTVGLANLGPDAATNVIVADLLPAGLRFVSANPSQGTYDPANGLWIVGEVVASASLTLVIQAVVTSPTAQSNVATINHADQFDTNPSNDTASVTETPLQADLRITKTVSALISAIGDTLTYTILVTNNGPGNALNVTVQDVLPTGVRFLSSSIPPTSQEGERLFFSLGTLAPGASATIDLSVVVELARPMVNVAVVSTDTFDPDTASNAAEAATTAIDTPLTEVVSLQRYGYHDQPTAFLLTFSTPIEPASAGNASNYQLFRLLHGGRLVRPIPIVSAEPGLTTVTLLPSRRHRRLRADYYLVVNGSTESGVRNTTGQLIDGNGDGIPGGDYARRFRSGILAGPYSALPSQAGAPAVLGKGLAMLERAAFTRHFGNQDRANSLLTQFRLARAGAGSLRGSDSNRANQRDRPSNPFSQAAIIEKQQGIPSNQPESSGSEFSKIVREGISSKRTARDAF